MVKGERQETELNEQEMVVTDELGQAILLINSLIPQNRSCVEPMDLVKAIFSIEGTKGRETIRIASNRKFSEVNNLTQIKQGHGVFAGSPVIKLNTGGGEISCSATLESLFRSAQEVAGVGNQIDSGHVILAETKRVNSEVLSIMRAAGVANVNSEFIERVMSSMDERDLYQESGRKTIPGFNQLTAKELVQVDALRTIDLMGMDLDEVVVKPEWVLDVLAAVETSGLVIIDTDRSDLVEMIITDMAQKLSGNGEMFDYSSLVVVDPGFLTEDPEGTMREALNRGRGGILLLPDVAELITNQSLKTAISKGKIKVISYANKNDWRSLKKRDRFLQKAAHVELEPASEEEIVKMFLPRIVMLEKQLGGEMEISITPESIEKAVEMASEYMRSMETTEGVWVLLRRAAMNLKIAASNLGGLMDGRISDDREINMIDVMVACEQITGIEVMTDDPEKYLKMESALSKRIAGQNEALTAVSDIIRESKAGLKDPNTPIGSFIFLGPSGVGKTELSKALAEFMFGDEKSLIRLDMSEYREGNSIARLFGAPPGYIGYDEGGQLTEAVRRRPYSIITLDEIEKAHPDVWNTLLQILSDGRMTDGKGQVVDFRNTVVIMTSNIGSKYFDPDLNLSREETVEAVNEKMKATFRPELIGRINEKVVFNSLNMEVMKLIVNIQIDKLNRLLEDKNVTVSLTEASVQKLAELGYSPEYGARPLRKIIRREINKPLTQLILKGEIKTGETVVDVDSEGQIILT
jgi:hypothetical protein